jgi:hypothetical protein
MARANAGRPDLPYEPSVRHGDKYPGRRLGLVMSTLQKRSNAALETYLSILFRNARDLELQLHELKKLRNQVWEAELSARKSRRTDNGIRERLGKGQGRTPEPVA